MKKIFFVLFITCTALSCTKNAVSPLSTDDYVVRDNGVDFYSQQGIDNYLKSSTKAANPSPLIPCDSIQDVNLYPDLLHDDYLHPERFWNPPQVKLYHILIINHCPTRKYINIFFPEANDSLRAAGRNDTLTFCDVKLTLTIPGTAYQYSFYDIFNWVDDLGRPIFNANTIMHDLTGTSATTTYDIQITHLPTGRDMNFEHTTVTLVYEGL